MGRSFGSRWVCTALCCWLAAAAPLAADDVVSVIVHASRSAQWSTADLRAVFLKQKEFWPDGERILAVNQEAGGDVRERFSQRLFGRGSRRLAAFWDQRYFEAGEFPPPTLASDEAVLRFVAGNRNAIGYIGSAVVEQGVSVLMTLD